MASSPSPSDIAALALLDEPTRRRLYEFVAGRDAVGRDAAADAVGISRELAAFHLDKLVEGGLLQTSFKRLSGRSGPGAGRPAKLYTRATGEIGASLPARRYELPAELFAASLERLADEAGPSAVAESVNGPARERGRAVGAAVRGTLGSRAARSRRREALVSQLADAGFEPTVDHQTGELILRNCPYRLLSEAHRDLTCGMNLAWAQGLLEGAGDTAYEARLDFQPGRCCVVFSPAAR